MPVGFGNDEMSDQGHRYDLPAELGPLFGDGHEGRELPIALPPGSLVLPDPNFLERQLPIRPAFWLSDGPAPQGLWPRLRAQHARSGLWPVLLDDSMQSWSLGQIAPEPPGQIDGYNVAAFMAEVWTDMVESRTGRGAGGADDLADLMPFGRRCPGPAPPGDPLDAPDTAADRCAGELADGSTRLALAAAARGADVLAVMGWQGAVNHNEWVAPLAAVVRSWEDRFGVRLVRMGFNTLDMSVAAPPVTVDQALHVAAEHWTFCPDITYQSSGTLAEYAERIRGITRWSFWWD
jgi:hypothetical protein